MEKMSMKNKKFKAPRLPYLLLVLALFALAALVACSTGGGDTDTATETTTPDPTMYTLNLFDDGTLSGKADCNNFSGAYSQENGFTITLGATTMAFCGEASLDQTYLQLLGSVAAGGPDGSGGLALETAGGAQRMMFKNGGPSPSQ